MGEEKITFDNVRGETLSGVLHHPIGSDPHGAVILCHGMESHKNSEKLIYLGRKLAEANVLALRFDFAYVGESSGKVEDITYSGEVEDLKAAFSPMQDRHTGKTRSEEHTSEPHSQSNLACRLLLEKTTDV